MKKTYTGDRTTLYEKLQTSPSSLNDNEVLELLLAQSLPQRKTELLARELISTFGSLTAVFSASPKDLMKVKGIGKKTATAIKFVEQVIKKVGLDDEK